MKIQSKSYRNQYSCAHAWAHQLSEEGYSSNFFFDGPTIYSYGRHFPIAALDGNRVFFTTRNYSNSTSQHKCMVRSAISHKQIIFVHDVPTRVNNLSTDSFFINENIDYWMGEIKNLIAEYELHPRRKRLLGDIDGNLHELETFVNALGIKQSTKLAAFLDAPSLKGMTAYYAEQKRKAIAAEKKRREKAISVFMANLADWRAGKIQTLPKNHPVNSNLAYLRWNESSQRVETSKDIRVPVEAANRLYDFIRIALIRGYTDHKYKILDFVVNEISPDYLVVGCHKIPMEEVNAIASLLGWDKALS